MLSDTEIKKKYGLREEYNYLKSYESLNDTEEFQNTLKCLNKIFDQKKVQSVIEIVISILNLGNIEILENKSISKIE